MLRSEWDVLPFLESGKLVQVLPEYAQSANISCYREPLYRSMKLRVCVEFLAAWCQQRLGKPMKAIRSCRSTRNHSDPFALSFEFRPDFVS